MGWRRTSRIQLAEIWLLMWMLCCALGLSDSDSPRWTRAGTVNLSSFKSPSTITVVSRFPYLYLHPMSNTILYDCSASCIAKNAFPSMCDSPQSQNAVNADFFVDSCTKYEKRFTVSVRFLHDPARPTLLSAPPERPVAAFGSSIALSERNILAVLANHMENPDLAVVFLFELAPRLPPRLLSSHDVPVAGMLQPQVSISNDKIIVSGRSNGTSILRCFPDLKDCREQEVSTRILPFDVERIIPLDDSFAIVFHDRCDVGILHSAGNLELRTPSEGARELCRDEAGVVIGVSQSWAVWASSRTGRGWGMELDTQRQWELPMLSRAFHQLDVDRQGWLVAVGPKDVDLWELVPALPVQSSRGNGGRRRLATADAPTSRPSAGPALCFAGEQSVTDPMRVQNFDSFFRFNRYKCIPNQFISDSPTASPTPPVTPSPTVSQFLCSFYSPASSTSSATDPTYSETTCKFTACGGMTVTAATCSTLGGYCNSDTFLRLVDSFGAEVAMDNDGCGGNPCSLLQYTVPGASTECIQFTLWQGCFDDSLCSGQSIVNFFFDGNVPTVAPTPLIQ